MMPIQWIRASVSMHEFSSTTRSTSFSFSGICFTYNIAFIRLLTIVCLVGIVGLHDLSSFTA